MKKSVSFFVFIVSLALGLMLLIVVTQVVTLQSLSRLQGGSDQATQTFGINNKLEGLVNLVFELENRVVLSSERDLITNEKNISDSLQLLLNRVAMLTEIQKEDAASYGLQELKKIARLQVDSSLLILDISKKKNSSLLQKLQVDFSNHHYGDSIYSKALAHQKGLEVSLGSAILSNSNATKQLANLNKLLAIVAVVAILLLVTIILRRQKKQLLLIEELKQAEDAARKAALVKDQFLANMSHELRTPLNAIKGFTNLMYKTALDDTQQKYTQIVSAASNNLLQIVNEVLDFAKIEAGAMAMKPIRFSLQKEIIAVAAMFEALAEEKNISLHSFYDKEIPEWLIGDSVRLHQVLVNLVGNAIKFSENGSVSIGCKLIQKFEDRSLVQIQVTDTGIGMSEEDLQNVFGRFEQADNSLTRKYGGTGLGLSIVKKTVLMMQGDISVESKLGKGSTFSIELNLQHATEEELLPIVVAESVDYQFGNEANILVIEDNKINSLLVESILQNYNLKTITANDGKEGLEKFLQYDIDLVLMDIQMPVMDGIEAAVILRHQHKTSVPIIAMTAHIMESEKRKCVEAGMNDYLVKPLEEQLLMATIKKFLELDDTEKVQKDNQKLVTELDGFVYLRSICNNDEGQMKMILKEMCIQLTEEVEIFNVALKDRNFTNIKKLMHNFKSTLMPLANDAFDSDIVNAYVSLLNVEKDENVLIEAGENFASELVATKDKIEQLLLKTKYDN